MNRDQAAGKWKQMKGVARRQWGSFRNDDLDVIAGCRLELIGKLQERYGAARGRAEKAAQKWGRLLSIERTVPH